MPQSPMPATRTLASAVETLRTRLRRARVLPVLVIDEARHAVPLAEALMAAGLDVVEFTLRTPAALEAVRAVRQAGLECLVGVGTVLNGEDLSRSVEAGAQFAVTPGVSTALRPAIAASAVPVLPGVATPSEAMDCADAGFSLVKFFPAEQAGGAAFLKALHGPLPGLSFVPTGSITPALAPDYLTLPNVVAVGGSWVAPKALMDAQDWPAITAHVRDGMKPLCISQDGSGEGAP